MSLAAIERVLSSRRARWAIGLALGVAVAGRATAACGSRAKAPPPAPTVPTAAQAQAPLTTDVPVERMHWTTDADGVLDVPWGTILPSLSLAAGLGMSYANDPLTIYRDEGDTRVRVASPVSGRAGAELSAALGVADLLEFSLAMPLVLQQSTSAGSLMLPSSSSAGVGDLRVQAKLGLLRQRTFGVDGAATLAVGFPTATSTSYIGESGPVAEPGVAVSRRFSDVWRATATLGYRVRARTESLALVVDDELVAQLGVGFKLAALSGPAVELDASLSVATAAGDALRWPGRSVAGAAIDSACETTVSAVAGSLRGGAAWPSVVITSSTCLPKRRLR